MVMIDFLTEYSSLVALLVATSIVTGFAAGLFGIGGGAILVPVLYAVFTSLGYAETAMHVALATSLATIILTSIRSVQAHHKKGAVDWAVLKNWAPWIMIGAVCGQITASQLSGVHLTVIFASLAFLLSAQLMLGKPNWILATQLPRGVARSGIGGSIGFFSNLMGIGGGVFGVTLMTTCGRPVTQAIGTAAGFGAAIGLPSALTAMTAGAQADGLPPLSIGYVNVAAFILISTCTVTVAPLGAKVAHSLNPALLKRAFGFLLLLVAIRMLSGIMS